MNDPKNNPTTHPHPEIGPRSSVGRVDRGVVVTGTITFKQQRPLLPGDPKAIIDNAIAGGDTIERRVRQFHEAMLPGQK